MDDEGAGASGRLFQEKSAQALDAPADGLRCEASLRPHTASSGTGRAWGLARRAEQLES